MQGCAGEPTRGVRTNQGVHTGNICVKSREIRTKFVRNLCEFRMNSREFTPMNRLQACRVMAPLVLGAVWACWMLLGRDLHWMMRNEAGGRILPPQIPQKEPKIWRFPPKTSKFGSIHVNIHATFKHPLIPRSRRVHTPRGVGFSQGIGTPACAIFHSRQLKNRSFRKLFFGYCDHLK